MDGLDNTTQAILGWKVYIDVVYVQQALYSYSSLGNLGSSYEWAIAMYYVHALL